MGSMGCGTHLLQSNIVALQVGTGGGFYKRERQEKVFPPVFLCLVALPQLVGDPVGYLVHQVREISIAPGRDGPAFF